MARASMAVRGDGWMYRGMYVHLRYRDGLQADFGVCAVLAPTPLGLARAEVVWTWVSRLGWWLVS